MSDVILKIENFSKYFRSHWTFSAIEAVKNVSLEVYRGESFGYLGHNGAGKTTTIKSLLGLIHKTSGHFYVDGKELTSAEQNKLIGYLPEQPYFYDHLTVYETLDFFARLHEIKEPERSKCVDETLELVKLTDRKKASVRSLSKGLQQRLAFGQAIINKPQLLLLDEPFSGLDPIGRMDIRKLILDLNNTGTTIFLSSHILSDVEDICNRVSIMSNGELKTVFDLSDAAEKFGQSYELRLKKFEASSPAFNKLSAAAESHEREDTTSGAIHIFRFAEYGTAEKAMSTAIENGALIDSFKSCALSLEEIFVQITSSNSGDNERIQTTESAAQIPPAGL